MSDYPIVDLSTDALLTTTRSVRKRQDSIFDTGAVDLSGNQISARPGWPVRVAGGTPVPVYVAAIGPKVLQVTGALADGTLPYLAGSRTIAEFIEPAIAKLAADAGRRKPRSSRRCPHSCPTTLMRQRTSRPRS